MKQIKVSFYKVRTNIHFHKKVEEVSFLYNCDEALCDYDNECLAFDEALRRRHDAARYIRMEWV